MRIESVAFLGLFLLPLFAAGPLAAENEADPREIPAIRRFLGTGLGSPHAEAPAELRQFGRLVGIWSVEQELRRQDGEWVAGAPGIWVWKYALDGFAVTDLWFQPADGLPVYMADLGRDYLLSAIRIFETSSGKWRVAWMANGAGKTPGADFGTFEAVLQDGDIVMSSPRTKGMGLQRIVFYEIGEDSFRWRSEYSRDDGETWVTVMRMHGRRLAAE